MRNQSYCSGAGVRRPSVRKTRFLGHRQSNAKFCGNLAFYHISISIFYFVFQKFKFLFNFNDLNFVLVNLGPYGSEIFKKATPPAVLKPMKETLWIVGYEHLKRYLLDFLNFTKIILQKL